jgi:monoamine oxidase
MPAANMPRRNQDVGAPTRRADVRYERSLSRGSDDDPRMGAVERDVIVVGGGFAGLRAASELAAAGRSVLLLEARERLGGRTWTVTMPMTDERVELGGGFITSDQHRVLAELERHAMGARPFAALPPGVAQRWTWRVMDELRAGAPVPADLLPEFERVAALLAADATDDDALILTLTEWCARHEVAPAVADMLRAAWAISAGAGPDAAAMVDLISSAEDHGGLAGMTSALSLVPVPGFGDLAEAMGRDLPDVQLGAVVTVVDTTVTGAVEVTLADGRAWAARAAVLAVPVNVLPSIAFAPERPASVTRFAGASTGASIKLIVQAGGVEPGAIAGGRGAGLDLLVADRRLADGTTMLVGFGPRAELPGDVTDDVVARAVGALMPAADVVRWAWHDWTTDAFALGTWAATRPGHRGALRPPDPRPEHGVVLAGSDVAPEAAGWVEGALASGEQAARQILALHDAAPVGG